MNPWAVIATGESLKPAPELVARKVSHLPTVAVSDAFRIAPWAKALVACDGKWWRGTHGALEFPGEKWCANGNPPGIPRVLFRHGINTSTNSGLLGLYYAVSQGAETVLLLGVDMGGTHYFGPHEKFVNTVPARFLFFIEQFRAYSKFIQHVRVINCSVNSALDVFPKMSLDDALAEVTQAAA